MLAPHLHFRVGRRPEQHKLRAALHGAPRGVLDEVDALLMGQPGDAANDGDIWGVRTWWGGEEGGGRQGGSVGREALHASWGRHP